MSFKINRKFRTIQIHEDPLTTAKKCKRNWFGLISRSADLTKTTLQVLLERKKARKKTNTKEDFGKLNQNMDRDRICQHSKAVKTGPNGYRVLQCHLWYPTDHGIYYYTFVSSVDAKSGLCI